MKEILSLTSQQQGILYHRQQQHDDILYHSQLTKWPESEKARLKTVH